MLSIVELVSHNTTVADVRVEICVGFVKCD